MMSINMWYIKNNTNEYIYIYMYVCKTETDSQTQRTSLWLPKGRGTNQGYGTDRY